MTRRCVLLAVLLCGVGCSGTDGLDGECWCEDEGLCVPSSGEATLLARTTYDDYAAATFSFEHATAEDLEEIRNDWDLLFGNDRHHREDLFSVNMVVDDRSFIVDLGPVRLADVPEVVDPSGFDVGTYGDHDYLPVAVGHLYVVRTVDSETRQYAAFRVVDHQPDRSVTIRWYRSDDPDRFAPPGR